MEDKQKANILESLATAVLITDKDFNIHYANTAAEQLCGVSRTKLISSKFIDFIDTNETPLIQTIKETNFSDNFQGISAAGIMISPMQVFLPRLTWLYSTTQQQNLMVF